MAAGGRLAIHSQHSDEEGAWEEVPGSVSNLESGSVSVQTSSFQRRYAVFRVLDATPSTSSSPENSTQGAASGGGDAEEAPVAVDVVQVDEEESVHQRIEDGIDSGVQGFTAVLDSEEVGMAVWILIVAAVGGAMCLCAVLTGVCCKRQSASRGLGCGEQRVAGYDAQVTYPCHGVSIVAECGFDYAHKEPSATAPSLDGVVHGRIIPAAYPSFEVLAKPQQPQEIVPATGTSLVGSNLPRGTGLSVDGGEWGVVSANLCFDENEAAVK